MLGITMFRQSLLCSHSLLFGLLSIMFKYFLVEHSKMRFSFELGQFFCFTMLEMPVLWNMKRFVKKMSRPLATLSICVWKGQVHVHLPITAARGVF